MNILKKLSNKWRSIKNYLRINLFRLKWKLLPKVRELINILIEYNKVVDSESYYCRDCSDALNRNSEYRPIYKKYKNVRDCKDLQRWHKENYKNVLDCFIRKNFLGVKNE